MKVLQRVGRLLFTVLSACYRVVGGALQLLLQNAKQYS